MSATIFATSNNQILLYLDDTTGNVAIGTSNNPSSSALYVRGSLNAECNLSVNGSITIQGGITTCNSAYLANSNDNATFPSFSWRQQSNVGMYLASNQSVGISTASTERVRIDNTRVTVNSNMVLLLQAQGGLSQFIAASNSCIGINTSNPSDTLSVNGNVFATSNVTASNIFSSNLTSFSNVTFGGGATISSWSLGGTWINLPTTGPSGLGTGGPGANPFLAYVNSAGNWFTNSVTGDTAYRNTSGRLLFGNSTGNFSMSVSNNQISMLGTLSNFNNVSLSSNLVVGSNLSVTGVVTSSVTTFSSNTSVFASNAAVFGSNNFAFSSNASVFASNTAVFTSNNLNSSGFGRILDITILESGTIYTPNPTSCNLVVTVLGAGGGGGGANANLRYGGGGGAGAYGIVFLSNINPSITYTYSIGAGGTSAGNTAGTTGGTTSITIGGFTFSCSGGGGGAYSTAATLTQGGFGGSNFTGPFTIQVPGANAAGGWFYNQVSGRGGDSIYGSAGQERYSSNPGSGFSAIGYGAGGGGAAANNTTLRPGGNGANGLIVIQEYT